MMAHDSVCQSLQISSEYYCTRGIVWWLQNYNRLQLYQCSVELCSEKWTLSGADSQRMGICSHLRDQSWATRSPKLGRIKGRPWWCYRSEWSELWWRPSQKILQETLLSPCVEGLWLWIWSIKLLETNQKGQKSYRSALIMLWRTEHSQSTPLSKTILFKISSKLHTREHE